MRDTIKIADRDVLLVVDVQNDFCPGGNLAVPHGDEVVPIINQLAARFTHVILTQDWHPRGHLSFASSHPGKQPFQAIEVAYGEQVVEELLENDDGVPVDGFDDVEPCLLSLAASKLAIAQPNVEVRRGICVDLDFAPKFREFQRNTEKDYTRWMTKLKRHAIRTGTPLRAEIMDMVYESHDGLGHAAEAESLGFNKNNLHPDMYMNELITGMRMIHQILPKILDKLDIKFTPDMAQMSADAARWPSVQEAEQDENEEGETPDA